MSLFVRAARAVRAGGVQRIGLVVFGALIPAALIVIWADTGAFGQAGANPTAAGQPATPKPSSPVPSFLLNPASSGWVRIRTDGRNALYGDGWLDPPPGLRGPITNHPDHPLQGNADRASRQVTVAMGNYMDPILKPWAAQAMRQSNEEVLSGKRGMPFLATSRCYPGSVPGQLLWTTEPFFFFPNPKTNVVYMVWERDSLVRRIYLADQHAENVKPSWYGESIGRYENGEFVVDTIGLATGLSFLDMYRTPHSDKLHVTERYKLTADGKLLEVLVKVEDADTLNAPMYMTTRWRKQERAWREFICAENNPDRFGHNLFPLPEAKTPDF
jgi:hypothetical protein